MSTLYECPACGELVYEAQFNRHIAKDHVPEWVEEVQRDTNKLITTLILEYGLGIDTIAILTGGQ